LTGVWPPPVRDTDADEAQGGESMSIEAWRLFWVIAAAVLAVAEMATAGFFMLPFAFGAGGAAIAAFLDANEAVQLGVFLGVSVVALVLLQKFVKRGDQKQHPVGSNRFIGQKARVIEAVDPAHGTGRVRMETEMWRATTEGTPIPEGSMVRVAGVRGTRLVVEPIEEGTP
jgi:membrane protein implicated in regulation of membrane protease activity